MNKHGGMDKELATRLKEKWDEFREDHGDSWEYDCVHDFFAARSRSELLAIISAIKDAAV